MKRKKKRFWWFINIPILCTLVFRYWHNPAGTFGFQQKEQYDEVGESDIKVEIVRTQHCSISYFLRASSQ